MCQRIEIERANDRRVQALEIHYEDMLVQAWLRGHDQSSGSAAGRFLIDAQGRRYDAESMQFANIQKLEWRDAAPGSLQR